MKLFEYQSQKLLNDYGIPVPKGETAFDPGKASAVTAALGGKSVVKAQVLTGGRGKAGGVKIANSPDEAAAAAEKILSMAIRGMNVKSVLVSEVLDINREYYISISVNRSARRAEYIFSAAGGVDIEETAVNSPDKIHRIPVLPFQETDQTRLRTEMEQAFGTGDFADQAVSIAAKMYDLFSEKDCSLVEINPLVLTTGGRLIAADAKITIDDNALIKHPELKDMANPEEYSRDETDARSAGLSFVSLDGDIGCIVNGAGLAMATMDLIKHFGASPANFLDVGGSSSPHKVVDALTILLRNRNIKAILMNIFGGITRCDDIANGVIIAGKKTDIRVPFIIRLIGTNDELGREILLNNGFHAYTDLTEAVQTAIRASGKGDRG